MSTQIDIIEQLLRLRRDELSPKEKAALENRLAQEPDLKELFGLLSALDTRPVAESDDALSRAASELANRIYQDYFLRGRGSRVPVGVTIFDSKLLPIPAGVRPAAVDTRQLRYQVADCEVILMLYPVAPDSYEIMGQIGEGLATGALTLKLRKRGVTVDATADEFGLFRFDRVPLGTYRLTLCADTRDVGLIHVTI
jgi:hypothetical protein